MKSIPIASLNFFQFLPMKASEYRKNKEARIKPETVIELALPSGAVFRVRRPPMEIWIAAGRIPQGFMRMAMAQNRGADTSEMDLSDDETMAAIQFTRDALLYAVIEPRLLTGEQLAEKKASADILRSRIEQEDAKYKSESVSIAWLLENAASGLEYDGAVRQQEALNCRLAELDSARLEFMKLSEQIEDSLDPAELDPEDFQFLTAWISGGSPGVPVQTKGGQTSVESLSRFRQKRTGGKPFSLEPDGGEIRQEAERTA